MIQVMRAPDDPYPDTLHRIIDARIAGDEVTALKAWGGFASNQGYADRNGGHQGRSLRRFTPAITTTVGIAASA